MSNLQTATQGTLGSADEIYGHIAENDSLDDIRRFTDVVGRQNLIDDRKLHFGTGQDVSFKYDGSDFILDLDEQGAGDDDLRILNGRLIIGRSSGTKLIEGSNLELASISENGGLMCTTWAGSSQFNRPKIDLFKSRNATPGSHTIVASGDWLGGVNWWASDGTQFLWSAAILAIIDGTPGTNDMPTRISFQVTADGASSPSEAFRIDADKTIRFGSHTALGGESVSGYITIKDRAGTSRKLAVVS